MLVAVAAVQVFGLTPGGGPVVPRSVTYDVADVERARFDLAHGVGESRLDLRSLRLAGLNVAAGGIGQIRVERVD
ncbi:MAG: hypothetical protein WD336_11075 [Trueperaceae bacterium]